MDPNLYKKRTAVKPFLRGQEKNLPAIHRPKKPETLREEQPWESGCSGAARRSSELAPANPSAVRRDPVIDAETPPRRVFPGDAAFRPPIIQGLVSFVQRLLLHRGPNLCKRKNRENEIFLDGPQLFNFALKTAGTLTILPPRSTKACRVVPVTIWASSAWRRIR
jgi:hypothetical protein